MSNASVSSHERFRFLDLPPEIRRMVYDYLPVITHCSLLLPGNLFNATSRPPRFTLVLRSFPISILQTCRYIEMEAWPAVRRLLQQILDYGPQIIVDSRILDSFSPLKCGIILELLIQWLSNLPGGYQRSIQPFRQTFQYYLRVSNSRQSLSNQEQILVETFVARARLGYMFQYYNANIRGLLAGPKPSFRFKLKIAISCQDCDELESFTEMVKGFVASIYVHNFLTRSVPIELQLIDHSSTDREEETTRMWSYGLITGVQEARERYSNVAGYDVWKGRGGVTIGKDVGEEEWKADWDADGRIEGREVRQHSQGHDDFGTRMLPSELSPAW